LAGLGRWKVEAAGIRPLVRKIIIEKKSRNITVGREETV